MAHFAKLDSNNIVLAVEVIDNKILDPNNTGTETEELGRQWLEDFSGHANWKQTSFNTGGNTHALGGTPFRKNYAKVGGTYDAARDAFIQPTTGVYPHFASWVLNETTCLYEAPKTQPTDAQRVEPTSDARSLTVFWNEETLEWRATPVGESSPVYKFDSTNKTWSAV